MMSQNRLAQMDRLEAHHDDVINPASEEEIRAVLEHLAAQDLALQKILHALGQTSAESRDKA